MPLSSYRSTTRTTVFPVTGLGALRVVYVTLTAVIPDFSWADTGWENVSDGFDCFRRVSSAATLEIVAGAAPAITMWTTLFLSANVVSAMVPFRAQPSG